MFALGLRVQGLGFGQQHTTHNTTTTQQQQQQQQQHRHNNNNNTHTHTTTTQWFGQIWSWPNLVWPNLVLAKLGLAKLGLGQTWSGQTWIWPNLVWPNLVIAARTRQPENSKRAHFSTPALQTPPKFHEKTPQRDTKKSDMVAGEGKKARNFGPSTLRGPTLRGPTLRGPTLRGPTLRGPTLRGPTLLGLGPHPSGLTFSRFGPPPPSHPSGPHNSCIVFILFFCFFTAKRLKHQIGESRSTL